MANVPVKLPEHLAKALAHRAARLGCSRGALGRALIAQGLDRLETAAAAWDEPRAQEATGARVIVTEAG